MAGVSIKKPDRVKVIQPPEMGKEMTGEVIRSIKELDASWLTKVLCQNGLLQGRVVEVELENIGEGVGLMSELARIKLTYEPADVSTPTSMVVKYASQNENKDIAQSMDFYAREVNFYRHLAPVSPIKTPTIYHAAFEPDGYNFVLLMEDLADSASGNQLVGATEAETYLALGQLAQLHGNWWGKVHTDEFDWLYDLGDRKVIELYRDQVYLPGLEPAIENFPDFFTSSRQSICRRLGGQYLERFEEGFAGPQTFAHGDYRLDNMFFTGTAERLDLVVVDWQISGIAKGPFDAAYFMSQSLDVDFRSRIEKEALSYYYDRLCAQGVTDYSFEDCWRDYRMAILICLIYPISVCGNTDLGNERGVQLAETMLERCLSAVEDLGCDEFLSA